MGMWIRDYAPKTLKEVIGQQRQVEELKIFVKDYSKNKKSIFLYGGTGNGKTASVYALANDLNYELVELNASDVRNKTNVLSLLDGVISQASLFGSSKMILIDEIEGLSGTSDRGAIPAIAEIIKKSKYPIIIIGADAYDRKFKALKKVSELIEFKPLSTDDLVVLLKKICDSENIIYDEQSLKQLARISGGDARAAINDLQTISGVDNKVDKDSLKDIGDRDTTKSMQEALFRVFKSTSAETSLGAFNDVNEGLDKIFLWVEENIPREYLEPKHLQSAFDNLSIADVFFGRIRRWQYYRFYVYCYALVTSGISIVKEKKYDSKMEYRETSRLLKIWMANMRNMKRKSIAQKVAAKTHTSTKEAFSDGVPFLKFIFQKNKTGAVAISKELDLSREEIDWLKK